jgi:hypothetical protein
MNDLAKALLAALLVLAACGDGSSPNDSAASGAPGTGSSTTTSAPPTTVSPPVTVAPSDVGAWEAVVMEQTVSPSCCDIPVIAPVSPPGPLPVDGWPADGFYSVTALRSGEPEDTIELEIHRWVSCSDFPDRCSPDPPPGGVTSDPEEWIIRRLALDDTVTVALWPLWTFFDDGPTALVGSGADFALLLTNGIDAAYMDLFVTPLGAGVSIEQVVADAEARARDEGFPFGRDAFGFGGAVYRAPLGARPTAPVELLATRDRPWPPGYNGLYDWWVTLEIRDGAPVLHLYANQIAG